MYVCMCILGFVMLPHAAPYSWLQLPQRQCTKNKKQKTSIFRLALPGRRPLGFEVAENLLAKSRSFRCYFVALGGVVALGLGEVSRHPLGEASKRLVAQVAFDSTPGVLRRRLCGRHQQHESGPTLETIGLAADVEAHAVLVSAAVLLVCCCVPGLLLCAVCCAVLCHF